MDGGMMLMMERKLRHRQWVLAAAAALVLGLSAPDMAAMNRPSAQASAQASSQRILIPGGKTVGIAIETEGLMVVGTS